MKNLKARDVMTEDVAVVEADWTLDELRDFFLARSISGAPVCDASGKMIGVVSTTDLMRSVSEGATVSEHELYLAGLDRRLAAEDMRAIHIETSSTTRVREIMTPLVFEVSPDDALYTIADMMIRGRIHRVFVTRGTKIVGVISALDLVRVMRDYTAPSKG